MDYISTGIGIIHVYGYYGTSDLCSNNSLGVNREKTDEISMTTGARLESNTGDVLDCASTVHGACMTVKIHAQYYAHYSRPL